MTTWLYSQEWDMGPITVGMVVHLCEDEVNAYRHADQEHYMLPGGAFGRLVAMWTDKPGDDTSDPNCVVRLGNGDQVLCCGQDICGWGIGQVEV